VNKNYQLYTGFFVHQRLKSAFKRIEFVSDVIYGTTSFLSGDCNAVLGTEHIFKTTIGNESLHDNSIDCCGVTAANFAKCKNIIKNTTFPH